MICHSPLSQVWGAWLQEEGWSHDLPEKINHDYADLMPKILSTVKDTFLKANKNLIHKYGFIEI